MIYATCPTCGYLLATKIMEYETKKEEICNNPKLNDEQQADAIEKLIQNIGLRRYCCRMRLMTCKDIVQDVIPVSDD